MTSEAPKVAILDDYAGAALTLADWSGVGDVTVFSDTIADPSALVARLRPFEVVCIMRERTPLPASILSALPNLRLVVTTGMRNQSLDIAAAEALGVRVCGTEIRGTTTAELTLALILALSRRIPVEAASLAHGSWQTGLGRDLDGLTLGVIGLGKLGSRTAALAQAFGMRVQAWSQNLTRERCDEVGVAHAPTLGALLETSDVVSVHLLLSERTRGLLGAAEFAAMKPDAIFVNTSRAPIADAAALVESMRRGRPGMAALDVFDEEPLPAGSPLRDRALMESGRLLLTPHLGYATQATFRLFYEQTAEAVRAWRAGAPVRALNEPTRDQDSASR
ncbi:D-2-hydroxyacid dehydrogenase family protein [Salinarimonas ramus]|uniref:2-hydroxyacid dehydrogenase n=1 Tax=Salinarimonas ramus TaxID=690164 RepID=A0A917V1K9_9HYPH|nr:D-2-hydroxyacid dehydrogenase family protein [Salinarimonas ramus]GGK20471.1 2-hydroxyacid dehydrogenase [Salinarimonas ramus]